MGNPVSTSKQNDNQKFLNIIYFVDANKTRSFKISMLKIKYILLGLSVLFIWSISSIIIFTYINKNFDVQKERLSASLATIFEYQTRYDKVYERTYGETNELVSKKNIEPATNPLQTPSKTTESTPHTHTDYIYNSDLKNIVVKKSSSTWPVDIENLNIHHSNDDIQLSFSIKNINSPKLTEGLIWAVVTVVDNNKNSIHIGSPMNLKIDEHGNVELPPINTKRYSIKYYKSENLYFPLNPKKTYQISHIRIGMINEDNMPAYFDISLRHEA